MPRRVTVLILSLAAMPVVGEAGPEGTAPTLHLVWLDPADVGSGSEAVARSEAASLLARMGATVSWRRGTPGETMREGEIWVVLLGPSGARASGHSLVLGATRGRLGVASVVWVRVPNVRAAVGVPQGRSLFTLAPGERRDVAVAIGRVIAHEVVHALVPSLPHGTGLMSERLTRRQLTAASIPVEPEAVLGLRAALRGDPVFPQPAPGLVADGPEAIR